MDLKCLMHATKDHHKNNLSFILMNLEVRKKKLLYVLHNQFILVFADKTENNNWFVRNHSGYVYKYSQDDINRRLRFRLTMSNLFFGNQEPLQAV